MFAAPARSFESGVGGLWRLGPCLPHEHPAVHVEDVPGDVRGCV